MLTNGITKYLTLTVYIIKTHQTWTLVGDNCKDEEDLIILYVFAR